MQLVLAKLGLESRSKSGALLWILPEKNEGKKKNSLFKKTSHFLKRVQAAKWPRFLFHGSSNHSLPGPYVWAETLLIKTISDSPSSSPLGPSKPSAPDSTSAPFFPIHPFSLFALSIYIYQCSARHQHSSPDVSRLLLNLPPPTKAQSILSWDTFWENTHTGTHTCPHVHTPPTHSRNICYDLTVLYITFSLLLVCRNTSFCHST